ncbi:MAG: universal stress protein [Schleiferilactobacillus perolens]|jgi:nucleotide-binding universal stress UspA family protein|uniref:universal stress protein n=1 Tax=Schleiferilactobacillus perolens TaxID=100468 RepID=UPI0039ED93E9|nr:universal stress protein [Schleiferilactobacillus harbinensis]MCI1911524.1 universal stress protein [Schleiferilactobacillus harbinensis]
MAQEYTNILVPLDGSAESERALNKAVMVAKLNHAHIDLLHVLDTKQFVGSYGGMITEDTIYQLSEDAQNYLQNIAEKVQEEDNFRDLSIHVRFGNPKTVIAKDFLEDHHNDLIMIGATGLNAVERLLVGSVTEYVNRHALCDVLVVKSGKVSAEGKEQKAEKPAEK